jgi:hypothetical protein
MTTYKGPRWYTYTLFNIGGYPIAIMVFTLEERIWDPSEIGVKEGLFHENDHGIDQTTENDQCMAWWRCLLLKATWDFSLWALRMDMGKKRSWLPSRLG